VIFRPHLGIKGLEAGRQDYGGYLDFYLLRCLSEIDGFILTDPFANTAFFLFQVKTAFIDIGDQGNGLGEVDVDGLILRYFLVKGVRVFDRTVFDAGRTTRTFALDDIPGFPDERCLEISCLPFDTVNFRIGEDLDVGMPADLDQFGGQNSHRAVIGRKGLIQLGHMAPDARRLLYQVDFETGRGQIQGGLNAADPSTDHQNIADITADETFRKLFQRFFFHCAIPSLDSYLHCSENLSLTMEVRFDRS
jgi:hypothetical protein